MFLTQPKSPFSIILINILGTTDTSDDDDFRWEDDDEEVSVASDGKPVTVKTKSSLASV